MTAVLIRKMTVLQLELSQNNIWHGFSINLLAHSFMLAFACGCCPLHISELSYITTCKAMYITLGNAIICLRRTRSWVQANCRNISVPLWLLHFGLLQVECIWEAWSRVAEFNYYCVKQLDPQVFNLPFSDFAFSATCHMQWPLHSLACLQYQMFWYDIEYHWLLITYCLLLVAMLWILPNS
jgi:hypothetical protein